MYENFTRKEKKELNHFALLMEDLRENLFFLKGNFKELKEKVVNNRNIDEIKFAKVFDEDNLIIDTYNDILSNTKIVYISINDIQNSVSKFATSKIHTKMELPRNEAVSLFELGAIQADKKREEIRTLLGIMPQENKIDNPKK